MASGDGPLIPRPVRRPGVDTIIAIEQPVLRNLWITLAYHDLADSVAAALAVNVSWCAFATWASKTAGVSIRGEELGDILRNLLRESPKHRELLMPLGRRLAGPSGVADVENRVLDLFKDPVQAVAALIAQGNHTVFRELGPLFAGLAALFDRPGLPGPDEIDAFVAGVRSLDGDPATDRQLQGAFRHYCAAAFEPAVKVRAEHVLLASGVIGFTEQTRLQPVIKAALDTPFGTTRFTRRLDATFHGVHALVGEWASALPLNDPLRVRLLLHRVDLIGELERLWREAITIFFLTLNGPEGPLRLGDDVPPVDGRQFPADLDAISDSDLQAFLATYDRTGGNGRGSGARDWADLGQRMNYIVNLFRSWQQKPTMLGAPFSAAQIGEMQAGRVPRGPL